MLIYIILIKRPFTTIYLASVSELNRIKLYHTIEPNLVQLGITLILVYFLRRTKKNQKNKLRRPAQTLHSDEYCKGPKNMSYMISYLGY